MHLSGFKFLHSKFFSDALVSHFVKENAQFEWDTILFVSHVCTYLALSRGHYTLYDSLKNLSPTILDVFEFPGLFVRDFTKNINNDLALGRLELATS